MKTFKLKLDPKFPIFDQVVAAAAKAILSGALKYGDPFPSVRSIATDLKIHPNTAHKVIQHLIQEGLLISSPGKGTTVAAVSRAKTRDRQSLLSQDIKQLVMEARRLGVSRQDVKELIDAHWKNQDQLKVVSDGH